jgi:hypothetical protein
MAVMGRPTLTAGEIFRARYCENIKIIYEQRNRATNWAVWAGENPTHAALLNEAERIYNEQSS